MEFIIAAIVTAVLGAGYTAVFLFYNREKAKEGCLSKAEDGFGCAHCGACGGIKEAGKQEGTEEKERAREKAAKAAEEKAEAEEKEILSGEIKRH